MSETDSAKANFAYGFPSSLFKIVAMKPNISMAPTKPSSANIFDSKFRDVAISGRLKTRSDTSFEYQPIAEMLEQESCKFPIIKAASHAENWVMRKLDESDRREKDRTNMELSVAIKWAKLN